jgi:Autophagy protein ATG9
VAKFVSFVTGSFAALLLGLSLLDENLLEVQLGGRNVVWWLALTGILLAIRCADCTNSSAHCVSPHFPSTLPLSKQTYRLDAHLHKSLRLHLALLHE